MKHKIFAVYDSKTEAWGMPLFFDCRANAIRSMENAVNDPRSENQICQYPADFTLFEIGEYDRATGMFVQYDVKVNLGLAIEYKKREDPVPVKSKKKKADPVPVNG